MATAREAAARPDATAEDVLWAVWRGQRSGRPVGRGQRPGWPPRRHRRPGPRRDAGALRRGGPVHRPAARRPHRGVPGPPARPAAARPTRWRPSADRGEAVRVLTAHAAKGLEWDVVAVVGVQEGVWPDLRLRGSVLGSERLVDIAAGRDVAAAGHVAAQVTALLDEERRLFYVAATRARRSLLVTAVDPSTTGSGGEEQPSRFLAELAARRAGAPSRAGRRGAPADRCTSRGCRRACCGARSRCRRSWPSCGRSSADRGPAAGPAAGGGGAAGPAGRRRRARAPTRTSGGACARSPTSGRWSSPASAVRVSPSTVESVLRCGLRWLLERHGGSNPPTAKQGIGNLVHAAAMLVDGGRARPTRPRYAAYVADRFDQIELPALWLGQRERDRAEQMVDKLLSWLGRQPARAARDRAGVRSSCPRGARNGPTVAHGDGSTGWSGTTRAGSSWSTSRPERAHRAPRTRPSTPSSPPTRWRSRPGAFAEGTSRRRRGDRGRRHRPRQRRRAGAAAAGRRRTTRPGPTTLVRRAATAMAASTFRAVVNDSCPYCAVRTSCPSPAREGR